MAWSQQRHPLTLEGTARATTQYTGAATRACMHSAWMQLACVAWMDASPTLELAGYWSTDGWTDGWTDGSPRSDDWPWAPRSTADADGVTSLDDEPHHTPRMLDDEPHHTRMLDDDMCRCMPV